MMKVTYKGMSVTEKADGTFKVTSDNGKYQRIVTTFNDVGWWLNEMANNQSIGIEICHRMCAKWERSFC